jgi:serine/threonine protein kinase
MAHAGNVLLTSSDSHPHGFSAKVADFGLARNLDVTSKVETRTYGTITHMPLELLRDGIMSKVLMAPLLSTLL